MTSPASADLVARAGRLALHVPEVVDVRHEGGLQAGVLGVGAGDPGEAVPLRGLEPGGVDVVDAEHGAGAREVGAVHLVGVDLGNCSAKYDRQRRRRHAAVDERAAADPAADVHGHVVVVHAVQDAGVGLMSLLTTSSHRKLASGASVRVRNHMERWSGAEVEQKTLPSGPGVFQSRPISRTRVRMPACPRRRAATAPP